LLWWEGNGTLRKRKKGELRTYSPVRFFLVFHFFFLGFCGGEGFGEGDAEGVGCSAAIDIVGGGGGGREAVRGSRGVPVFSWMEQMLERTERVSS